MESQKIHQNSEKKTPIIIEKDLKRRVNGKLDMNDEKTVIRRENWGNKTKWTTAMKYKIEVKSHDKNTEKI